MSNLVSELECWFSFSHDFNAITQSLIDYCDSLIEKAEKFDRLLSTKSKDEKGAVHIVGAEEKLKDLKSWIETKAEEFERTKQEIINLLPLDSKQIENCIAEISKAYNETSEIHEVWQVVQFVQKRDRDLKFVQIYRNPQVPKDCLTDPSSANCSSIWSDLGRSVAFGEINYFIKRIFEFKKIERVAVSDTSIERLYDQIKVVVNDLKIKGFPRPSVSHLNT